MSTALFPVVPGLCSRCLPGTRELNLVPVPADGAAGCRSYSGLAEHANIVFHAATTEGPTVGDENSHTDRLVDDAGREVGSISGRGWKVYARPDGHVMSFYREEITLSEGSVQTCGWMDSTAVWAGGWQTLHAVGTGGELLGLVGVRQIRQVRPRELYTANLVLCAAPARS